MHLAAHVHVYCQVGRFGFAVDSHRQEGAGRGPRLLRKEGRLDGRPSFRTIGIYEMASRDRALPADAHHLYTRIQSSGRQPLPDRGNVVGALAQQVRTEQLPEPGAFLAHRGPGAPALEARAGPEPNEREAVLGLGEPRNPARMERRWGRNAHVPQVDPCDLHCARR